MSFWWLIVALSTVETITSLSQVNIVFLPFENTWKIQLMKARLIAALKIQYQRFHLHCALDLICENVEDIYGVYILMEITALKIESEAGSRIILGCWTYKKLIDNPKSLVKFLPSVESCHLLPNHLILDDTRWQMSSIEKHGSNDCEKGSDGFPNHIKYGGQGASLLSGDQGVSLIPCFHISVNMWAMLGKGLKL